MKNEEITNVNVNVARVAMRYIAMWRSVMRIEGHVKKERINAPLEIMARNYMEANE